MVGGVREILSGLTRDVHSITVEGSQAVLHSTLSGVHAGSWGPIQYPPTGERISISGVAAFEIIDGKIISEPWSNWNVGDTSQRVAVTVVRKQAAAACVRKLVADVWNGGDPGAADLLMAPGVRLVTPWSTGVITGVDAVKTWLGKFRDDNPGARFDSIVHMNHDSGETVLRTWTAERVSGHSTGLAMTRFENGRIVEDRICC